MLDFSFASMFDLTAAADFSRQHCVGICAALVPANLLATLQTLIFAGLGRPRWQRSSIAGMALVYATLMVLHVWSWFAIGVVMAPTFILLALALVCAGLNGWAIAAPLSLRYVLRSGAMQIVRRLPQWNRLKPQT